MVLLKEQVKRKGYIFKRELHACFFLKGLNDELIQNIAKPLAHMLPWLVHIADIFYPS